jgi:hypothetical protein
MAAAIRLQKLPRSFFVSFEFPFSFVLNFQCLSWQREGAVSRTLNNTLPLVIGGMMTKRRAGFLLSFAKKNCSLLYWFVGKTGAGFQR